MLLKFSANAHILDQRRR